MLSLTHRTCFLWSTSVDEVCFVAFSPLVRFIKVKCTMTRRGHIITHNLSQWSDFPRSAAACIAPLKDVDVPKKESVYMWVRVHVLGTYVHKYFIWERQCICMNHVCYYRCIETDGKISCRGQYMIDLSIYDIPPLSFSATLQTMRWHSIRFKSHESYRVDMWNNINTEMNTFFFELNNNRQQSWNWFTAVVVVSAVYRSKVNQQNTKWTVHCQFLRHTSE